MEYSAAKPLRGWWKHFHPYLFIPSAAVSALFGAFLLHPLAAPAQDTSLLMVHFGTTYDDTRQKTIDAINEKARTTFPQM